MALHQLVDALRRLDLNAFLAPFPGTESNPDVQEYQSFDAPIHVGPVPDDPSSVIVVPEAYVPLARQFKQATPVIWWLSIDKSTTEMFRMAKRRGELWNILFWREYLGRARRGIGQLNTIENRRTLRRAIHIAQSHYAWAYLYVARNISASIVSDYTYTAQGPGSEVGEGRSPGAPYRVAYNPMKGGQYIPAIRSLLPEVEWLPLTGMRADQVANALASCHVYLDLGFHPGKDRIPREAALAGCAVVTRRIGAAAFHDDMPLPWSAKVGVGGVDSAEVARVVRATLSDLQQANKAQRPYVDWILGEEARFLDEVQRVFVLGQLGHNPCTPPM
ncbi:hypothetical protein [Nocardioides pantholopis]|uniref:hypothetical protein n=1 Tax=Nocardioides pantholopis TaxID=2483798 RepID=UPI0013DDFED8|nr:hypothetical protein [Nocardioides pantholopis]